MTDPRAEFIIESREHLAIFERSLLSLEKASDGEASRSLIEHGLRAVHSLKGDSGFLGFTNVRNLAHAMESVLEEYRDGSKQPSFEVIETLLVARDRLAILLEDLDHSEQVDIRSLLDRLEVTEASGHSQTLTVDLRDWEQANSQRGLVELFRGIESLVTIHRSQWMDPIESLERPIPSDHPCRLTIDVSPLPHGSLEDLVRFLGSAQQGPSKIQASPTWRSIETDLTEWESNHHGSLMTLLQSLDNMCRPGSSSLLWPTCDLREGLPAGPLVWQGEVDANVSLPDRISSATTASIPSHLPGEGAEHPTPPSLPAPPAATTPAATATPATATPATSDQERLRSLRINVELLDRLMNLIGELTLIRNQTQVTFREQEGEGRNIIQRLNSVTTELQDTVLQTRMQPVGNLFGRFPRMVRDLARQLGKEVEVVTIGQEVELDKTVLERLSDPLTHLIRNSIDHGIEMPSERIAAGKPSMGRIVLSATPADGQVCIEIRDDGRGINPEAVRAKALAMRLRTEIELARLHPKELFSLILLPGFSTAKQVTDVSGRGVGMDVVKTNVEELEGTLTIDSWQGQGTSMMLRVPLTLAIVPCLVATVGDERFAVPQRELEEIVCLHPKGRGSLEQAFDTEVYRLRDNLLPVVRLLEVLTRRKPFSAADKLEIMDKYARMERDENRIEYILVVRSNGKRFGLLVDNVLGREEIVVKPMHAALKQLRVFSGATLMGDGRVALIANVEGIVEHARCFAVDVDEEPQGVRDPHEVHRVLLFENGPLEQFALPLIQVRRVEMLEMDRIERVGEQEYVTIDGASTRILRLDQAMSVSVPEKQSSMFLILPKFVPEPMGILASRIIDTESLAIDLQSMAQERGVLGTAIVRDRLSLFLDVQQLREFLFGIPSDRPAEETSVNSITESHPAGPRRILLVDDTPFFREVVKRYLSSDQLEIRTAIDGKQGLEILSQEQFDLVVSDIEMPNMDGWQFCKAAREKGIRIPFVALTSLAKHENEEKAKAFGFDDFEEKLDHDRLRRKVMEWLDISQERRKNR